MLLTGLEAAGGVPELQFASLFPSDVLGLGTEIGFDPVLGLPDFLGLAVVLGLTTVLGLATVLGLGVGVDLPFGVFGPEEPALDSILKNKKIV